MAENYETKVSFGTTIPGRVKPPRADVVEKQDKGHTKSDFLRDLDKATQRKSSAS